MMLAVGAWSLPPIRPLLPVFPGTTVAPLGGTVATDIGSSYSVVYATSYTVNNGPGMVAATVYADIVKVGTTYDFLDQVVNTGGN
jgi:hypothetical protein